MWDLGRNQSCGRILQAISHIEGSMEESVTYGDLGRNHK